MFFPKAHVARYRVASRTERCHLFVEEGLRGVFVLQRLKASTTGVHPGPLTGIYIYTYMFILE